MVATLKNAFPCLAGIDLVWDESYHIVESVTYPRGIRSLGM